MQSHCTLGGRWFAVVAAPIGKSKEVLLSSTFFFFFYKIVLQFHFLKLSQLLCSGPQKKKKKSRMNKICSFLSIKLSLTSLHTPEYFSGLVSLLKCNHRKKCFQVNAFFIKSRFSPPLTFTPYNDNIQFFKTELFQNITWHPSPPTTVVWSALIEPCITFPTFHAF